MQFVLKCALNFSKIGVGNRGTGLDHDKLEAAFLLEVYGAVEDILNSSANASTSYSSTEISSAQKHRGSSLETAAQRSKYISLCTKDVTSEVLNISFRTKSNSDTSTVINASNAVIKFLLRRESPFRNEYSMVQLKAIQINGTENSFDTVFIPGGLLFQILTLALISYREDQEITTVVETYGGKKRGKRVYWDFNNSDLEAVQSTIQSLKKAEEEKIPATIIKVFRALKNLFKFSISKISINWGIGCDAMGSKLKSSEPSFLVCQPVNIESVDKIRRGLCGSVFKNPESKISSNRINFSALTRGAATATATATATDSDSDSYPDSDEEIANFDPVRYKWFLPVRYRHHNRYIPFGQLCPFNLHSVTHNISKRKKNSNCGNNLTGNEILDKNVSLRRVQSYSPNIRAPHGYNGVQKVGESLMDIRNFVKTTDYKKQSYLDHNLAGERSAKWLEKARDHIKELRNTCGMARLELTFEVNNLDDNDQVLHEGINTLIQTFVQSTKVYSGELVANLADISLLSFEGLSNALTLWFSGKYVQKLPCHNVYAEIWQYLTYVARNFFSGRRSYETRAFYTPRLGYLFSRPLLNPSWDGINDVLLKICVNEENMSKLKKIWYNESNMPTELIDKLNGMRSIILMMDTKFDSKFNAYLELLGTNCDSVEIGVNDAIACTCCKRITAKTSIKDASWKNHPCIEAHGITPSNMDLRSNDFSNYLEDLKSRFSDSQREACGIITTCDNNCFLTGVAGSGKSYVLKYVYPFLIRKYGFTGVSMTASTNIAATSINGATLHRFMGLIAGSTLDKTISARDDSLTTFLENHVRDVHLNKKTVAENATLCKVVIVDEAGMCDMDLFYFLHIFLQKIRNCDKPFGGVRIILVGDILQLAPIVDKNLGRNGKYFFEADIFTGNFFIAYLRENHRQKDTSFLEALNKVRSGDASVIEYLNNDISSNNITSHATLLMASQKSDYLLSQSSKVNRYSLEARAKLGYIYLGRNNSSYFIDEDQKTGYKKRLEGAPRTKYSDLIVCLEHNESDAYSKFRDQSIKKYTCLSSGTEYKHSIPTEVFESIERKLPKKLEIYLGMPCRVTYRTENDSICSNTLVIIIDIDEEAGVVKRILVKTTSPDFQPQDVYLKRVTISEDFNGRCVERTQFSLTSAIGLLPWSLQCLTISENIFYDNSRSANHGNMTKGLLYTIMSRVKSAAQFSFLYKITEGEITNGVSEIAKSFDDKYRLGEGVIFDLICLY